jgi:surface polysaccharide O-acyltransferase-like enzyme
MADALAPKPDRNLAIDAIKGVGILQVVLHHTLGQSARLYAQKGDWAWTLMRFTAWFTNFAIPLFLLLSAMLLAGSVLRQSPKEFIVRRLTRTLWPYLLWSLIFWLLRWWQNPHTFDRPGKLLGELLAGKAEYHLYFMIILMQLTILLPAVVWLLRRWKVGFGTLLAVSAALQGLAFLVNRVPMLSLKNPGSSITWYIPALLVGAWIGLNRETFAEVWRRWWPAFAAVGLVAGAAFAWLSVRMELKLPIESLSYNSLSVVFRVGASLALLGAAVPLAATRVGPTLAALGRYSLAIYLAHPPVLKLMSGPRISALLGHLPAPAIWVTVIVTALTYFFGWLTTFVRLDVPLFGQKLPRQAPATS